MNTRLMGIYDLGLDGSYRSLLKPGRVPACPDLARALKTFVGCGEVFVMETGRMALLAALRLMECGGRDVLVNAYTTDVVHNTIRAAGANPVFFDISPEDLSPRMESVERALSGNTAAVIHTGLFGFPSNPLELRGLADSRGIPMLEDACNSFGCSLHGKRIGTIGDAGILSFRVGKPLSSGGGALLVNSPCLLAKLRSNPPVIGNCSGMKGFLRLQRVFLDYLLLSPFFMRYVARPVRNITKGSWLGRLLVRGGVVDTTSIPDGESALTGMGSAQCRLAMLNLNGYRARIRKRVASGAKLLNALKGFPLGPVGSDQTDDWNGLFLPVLLTEDRADAFQRFLRGKGIDASRFHYEVPGMAVGNGLKSDFPGSAYLSERLVCLPCPHEDSGRDHLIDAVKEFFKGA